MSESKRRTVEQERARYAADCVNEAKRIERYGSYCRRAGALIQTQGLGQALAFWYSKRQKEQAYDLLYSHMSKWLSQRLKTNKDDILQWIREDASTEDYRRATAEAQAFLIWLKRFAEAELGDDHNG